MNTEILKYLDEVEKFLASDVIGEKTFGEGGCKITVGKTKNGFYTKCEVDTTKEDFENYLKSLDDDIFEDACEYMNNKFGHDVLSIIDKLMKENTNSDYLRTYIDSFKDAVRNVAQAKIEYLNNKYLC